MEQKEFISLSGLFRFDFTHFSKLTEDEINKIETSVNLKIKDNISLQEYNNIPLNE